MNILSPFSLTSDISLTKAILSKDYVTIFTTKRSDKGPKLPFINKENNEYIFSINPNKDTEFIFNSVFFYQNNELLFIINTGKTQKINCKKLSLRLILDIKEGTITFNQLFIQSNKGFINLDNSKLSPFSSNDNITTETQAESLLNNYIRKGLIDKSHKSYTPLIIGQTLPKVDELILLPNVINNYPIITLITSKKNPILGIDSFKQYRSITETSDDRPIIKKVSRKLPLANVSNAYDFSILNVITYQNYIDVSFIKFINRTFLTSTSIRLNGLKSVDNNNLHKDSLIDDDKNRLSDKITNNLIYSIYDIRDCYLFRKGTEDKLIKQSFSSIFSHWNSNQNLHTEKDCLKIICNDYLIIIDQKKIKNYYSGIIINTQINSYLYFWSSKLFILPYRDNLWIRCNIKSNDNILGNNDDNSGEFWMDLDGKILDKDIHNPNDIHLEFYNQSYLLKNLTYLFQVKNNYFTIIYRLTGYQSSNKNEIIYETHYETELTLLPKYIDNNDITVIMGMKDITLDTVIKHENRYLINIRKLTGTVIITAKAEQEQIKYHHLIINGDHYELAGPSYETFKEGTNINLNLKLTHGYKIATASVLLDGKIRDLTPALKDTITLHWYNENTTSDVLITFTTSYLGVLTTLNIYSGYIQLEDSPQQFNTSPGTISMYLPASYTIQDILNSTDFTINYTSLENLKDSAYSKSFKEGDKVKGQLFIPAKSSQPIYYEGSVDTWFIENDEQLNNTIKGTFIIKGTRLYL